MSVTNAPLTREQIAALIPHGDSMCMLDEVSAWDAEQIQCRSLQFAGEHNPLFEDGRLETVLLIEYAAQAGAIHAALLQSELGKPRPAYIGAVKSIELLAMVDNSLAIDISAHCLLNSSSGAIYEFVATQTNSSSTNSTLITNSTLMKGRLILNQP